MLPRGGLPPRADLRIRRLRTAGQLAWPSRPDRQLRPWPSCQIWKLELRRGYLWRLDFDGFETTAVAPCHHDEHDVNFSSDHTQEIAPIAALALDPEQIAPSEDGKLNLAIEAAVSVVLEPNTDLTSN